MRWRMSWTPTGSPSRARHEEYLDIQEQINCPRVASIWKLVSSCSTCQSKGMKFRRALCVSALATAHAALFGAAVARAQDREETVKVNGYSRTFLVHTPAGYTARKRYPVVVALHGVGGDAAVMARLSHFDDIADKHSFIVVYPNAREGRWTNPEDEGSRTPLWPKGRPRFSRR